MKKLMIVGAGVYQVPIIEKAKRRGLYTIAISPYGDYPGLKVADKTYDLDVRDEEGILQAAIRENIDGITTDQTDMAMRSVAYVAEKLGLPGIGYECAKLFTDKYAMRRKSEELGLPSIKCAEVDSYESAEEFFTSLGTPVILKPVDNQGSRGVCRVDNLTELKEAFAEAQKYSPSGNIIIEQFIEGDEFEVDSVVIDGQEHTLMYGDIVLFDIPNVFSSCTRMYPSCRDPEVVERLLKLNKDTIEGFGLKCGLTHSEYIADRSGQPFLIEAAARGGGAFVSSDITLLQTGLDTSEYLIDMALGEPINTDAIGSQLCHCGTLSFYLPEGTVVKADGIKEALDLDFVTASLLGEISVGMKTEPFSDKTARYISVLKADSREKLEENYRRFRNTLDIEVETPNGIEGPIWK